LESQPKKGNGEQSSACPSRNSLPPGVAHYPYATGQADQETTEQEPPDDRSGEHRFLLLHRRRNVTHKANTSQHELDDESHRKDPKHQKRNVVEGATIIKNNAEEKDDSPCQSKPPRCIQISLISTFWFERRKTR
jgi:hypothetical protein